MVAQFAFDQWHASAECIGKQGFTGTVGANNGPLLTPPHLPTEIAENQPVSEPKSGVPDRNERRVLRSFESCHDQRGSTLFHPEVHGNLFEAPARGQSLDAAGKFPNDALQKFASLFEVVAILNLPGGDERQPACALLVGTVRHSEQQLDLFDSHSSLVQLFSQEAREL